MRAEQSNREAAKISTAGVGFRGVNSGELTGVRNPNSLCLRAQSPAGQIYSRNEENLYISSEGRLERNPDKPKQGCAYANNSRD